MRTACAVAIGLVCVGFGTPAFADEGACKPLGVLGAALLEQCGEQLHSFALDLSDLKREVSNDAEGHFTFDCPVSIMCDGSPAISGFFVDADKWKASAKDAQAIGQIMQGSPITAESAPANSPKPAPAPACAPFDVTISGASGKGACFNDAATKTATVAMVFADDGVGYLLSFSQKGIAADKLKDSAVAMLPNFKIDRAKGDLGLMRWMR
jgi:hypothetical protein